jgi:hypothetical protein
MKPVDPPGCGRESDESSSQSAIPTGWVEEQPLDDGAWSIES